MGKEVAEGSENAESNDGEKKKVKMKRKASIEDENSSTKKKSKTKNVKVDSTNTETELSSNTIMEGVEPSDEKKRFILFVGNLPFDQTKEDIVDWFNCLSVMDFRLLTKKDGGSKGCGFLELPDEQNLNAALKLNLAQYMGRRINVQLSAGGGGKSKKRTDKIALKNRKRREKLKKKNGEQST